MLQFSLKKYLVSIIPTIHIVYSRQYLYTSSVLLFAKGNVLKKKTLLIRVINVFKMFEKHFNISKLLLTNNSFNMLKNKL